VSFASEKDPDVGAIQDLYLMTQCQHYILSNSTLHWWGAWLNSSTCNTVIAPSEGWTSKDTLPGTWLTI